MARLLIRKSISSLMREAEDPTADSHQVNLQRHLTGWHLALLGIGGIVGAGIFSLSGLGAANYAGPAIVYSFIVAGILCALAGLCYAEMASMVPLAGSAYTYSYATMGEFIAWIIGWDLILEYTFGAVTVSSAWSGYFLSLVSKTLGIELDENVLPFFKGPWEMVTLADGRQISGIWNVPASIVALLITCILYRGIRESARFNNVIVFVKITIVITFIILGWSVVDPANWNANPAISGWQSLIPPVQTVVNEGLESLRFGWSGVLTGAGVVFFAYIGFDAVSTAAQECKDPKRDLPFGILVSLFFCTILYILMSLVMTGVVHYSNLGVADPVAVGIDRIIELRNWGASAQFFVTFAVKVGALLGLTSVILVLMLGQTRIFYSMARDGLLPWFYTIHPKFKTPHIATATTGVFVALCAGVMPLALVGELVSIGTLLAFVVVCLGIPILRITDPHTPRSFRVRFHWVTSLAGAGSCIWIMTFLPSDTWLRLIIWLIIGLMVYFLYGIKHSKIRQVK